MRIVKKAIYAIVCIFVCFVMIEFVSEMFFPAGIQTASTRRAAAFLFSDSEYHELPNKVEIKLDGMDKTFRKGTPSYNQLINLLHNGRSDSSFQQAGPIPSFSSRHPVGELVISSYGLPSHFRITRSDTNPNYYWIGLPKLTTPGISWPIFTVDPNVIAFIRSQ